MKLFSLAVVLILLFADATAADFLKPRWKVSVKDDVYTITFDKGKGGFMQGELPMKAGEYAMLTFDAEINAPGGYFTFSATGFADKLYNQYYQHAFSGKGKFYFTFYAATDTVAKLQLNLASAGKDLKMVISNLKVKKFTTFDKLDLSEYEALHNNPKTPGMVTRVSAEDHLEGGFADKIVATDKRAKGATFKLPIMPGQKYKLSFWAKASKTTRFNMWIDGWTSGQKHWYAPFKLSADTEFAQYEIEFTSCPEITRYRAMVIANFQLMPNNDLTVKGIKLERISK